MKKKVLKTISLLTAGAMALSLSACGTNDEVNQTLQGNSGVAVSGSSGESSTVSDDTAVYMFQLGDITQYVEVGDYSNLQINLESSYVADEEEANSYAQYYYGQVAGDVAAEDFILDRAVEDGDIVNIDYTGYKDGEAFDGGSTDGAGTALWIGSDSYIDGFEDGLIGVMPGETVDLNLTFPENYSSTDLAGAEVVFTVTVNGIIPEEKIVEVWNTSYGDDAADYQGIVDYFNEYLSEDASDSYDQDLENALRDKVIEISTYKTDFPATLVETYQTNVSDILDYYASYYSTDADTLAQYMLGCTAAEYISEESTTQLQFDAACVYIAGKEGLFIDDDAELTERITHYLTEQGSTLSVTDMTDDDKADYRMYFIELDVLDFLESSCTVTTLDD